MAIHLMLRLHWATVSSPNNSRSLNFKLYSKLKFAAAINLLLLYWLKVASVVAKLNFVVSRQK